MTFSTNYVPTPLEHAYSLYLLDTVLCVPREGQSFCLGGRLAVPFLSSSGVDRQVLRQLWNIVDPTAEGSLLELIQFTSVLKLVSLAQHKWLQLDQYEGQLVHRQHVPLATFVNAVVPNAQLLLERYPPQIQLLSGPTEHLSVSDAFGDLMPSVDAPIMPSWQQQQQQQQQTEEEDFGDFEGTHDTTLQEPQEEEDFGDFEGTHMDSTVQNNIATIPDDDDDFGDFTEPGQVENVPSTADPVLQYPSHNGPDQNFDAGVTTAVPGELTAGDSGQFGDFETSTEQATVTASAPEEHSMPLGVIGGKAFPNTSNSDHLNATDDPFSSAFDIIQPIEDQPLPTLGGVSTEDDSFGDFEAPHEDNQLSSAFDATQGITSTVDTAPSASPDGMFGDFEAPPSNAAGVLSSAFDAIEPIHDKPMPSHVAAPVTMNSQPIGDVQDLAVSSALDVLQPLHDQPIVPSTDVPVVEDDSFGEFETPAVTRDTFTSAFDSITSVPDEPLPKLTTVSALGEDDLVGRVGASVVLNDPLSSALEGMQSDQNHVHVPAPTGPPPAADDSFGNYEAPSAISDLFSSAFDEIQPAQNRLLPTLDNVQPSSEDNSFRHSGAPIGIIDTFPLAFDGIQPVAEQPFPSLGAVSFHTEDDLFGDFEAPTGTADAFRSNEPDQHEPISKLALVPPSTEDDSFGDFEAPVATAIPLSSEFNGVQGLDQPLPTLSAVAPSTDDDSFGDFEAPAATKDSLPPATEGVLDGHNDRAQLILPTVPPSTEDDSFGDFAAPPGTADPFSLAFDNLQSGVNLPLPTLATMPPATEDDSFGDFEAPAVTDDPNLSTHHHSQPSQEKTLVGISGGDRFSDYDAKDAAPIHSPLADVGDSGQVRGLEPVTDVEHIQKANETDILDSGEDSAAQAPNDAPKEDMTENPKGSFEFISGSVNTFNSVPTSGSNQETNAALDDPFAAFDLLGETQPTALAPLSSFGYSATAEPDPFVTTVDDSFGEFATQTIESSLNFEGNNEVPRASMESTANGTCVDTDTASDFSVFNGGAVPTKESLPSENFAVTEEDEDFGDFEGVSFGGTDQEPAVSNDKPIDHQSEESTATTSINGLISSINGFPPTLSSEASNPQHEFAAFDSPQIVNDSALPVQQGYAKDDDDDDWGDFEHVQAPVTSDSTPKDDFSFFASAPAPSHTYVESSTTTDPVSTPDEDLFSGFSKAPRVDEFADFMTASVPSEQDSANPAAGTSSVAADSYSFEPTVLPSSNVEDEFGDWDGFQDAPSFTPTVPLKTVEEYIDAVRSVSLRGGFTSVDLGRTLEKNLLTKKWASSFASKANSGSLDRVKRSFQLVSLLSSSHSNLVLSDWNRCVSVARDEIVMGSFLLKESKSLSKEHKAQVQPALNTMVSGLSEFVRVVRGIAAAIADVLCLDLKEGLSRENIKTTWLSLETINLALEVEETWKSVESASKVLKLKIRSSQETIQTIRARAVQDNSLTLCSLTLQPVTKSETTKNEVIWEGKPFMACAANFWSHKVSKTFP